MWSIDPIVGKSLPRQSAEDRGNKLLAKIKLKTENKLSTDSNQFTVGIVLRRANRYTDKSLPLDTPREQKLLKRD
jgi:hypothetical protein